jgi:hypothetical protein
MKMKVNDKWIVIVLYVLTAVSTENLCARGSEDIVKSLLNNFSAMSTFEASLDIYYSVAQVKDMSESLIRWKRNPTGVHMQLYNLGSPYWATIACDGINWFILDADSGLFMSDPNTAARNMRTMGAIDLFMMENVTASHRWKIDTTPRTVNSTECYKLFTTKDNNNYEMWIDAFSAAKVIRVKTTDKDNQPEWQLDYADYQRIDGRVWLPYTITVTSLAFKLKITCSFTNIELNQDIPNTAFHLQ